MSMLTMEGKRKRSLLGDAGCWEDIANYFAHAN